MVDPVQAEQAGDNQIDRHCDADDAGREQQKHTRGQGDEWQEGAGCIGMHPASIPDSMALARSTVTCPCAGADRLAQQPAAGECTSGTPGVAQRRVSVRRVCIGGLKAGRIRSLVFFSPNRAPNFPDVPTTEEATGHKWHKGVWRGFAAPKGLPKEIAALRLRLIRAKLAV